MSTSIDPHVVIPATEDELSVLLALRRSLLDARAAAGSPAVARALEMADIYLFLGLSYLGYSDELYPEEALAPNDR